MTDESPHMAHALSTLTALEQSSNYNVTALSPFSNWNTTLSTGENLEKSGCGDWIWTITTAEQSISDFGGPCGGSVWITSAVCNDFGECELKLVKSCLAHTFRQVW
jgi:hypothetical protein